MSCFLLGYAMLIQAHSFLSGRFLLDHSCDVKLVLSCFGVCLAPYADVYVHLTPLVMNCLFN